MTDTHGDRADIEAVLVRYATGIDRRDWSLFRSIWSEDVDADYGRIGHFRNADEITDFMVASHERMGSTWHRLSNFAIDVDGDAASARTYVHAVLNVDKEDPEAWLDVIGHYDDTLVRTAGGWKIARRRTGRARMIGPAPPPLPP
jgi:3-phenylpropionate/cinnamic acid dioxygenase small subunit